jgi:histone H3/H4
MENKFLKINDSVIINFLKSEGFNQIHSNTLLALKIKIVSFLKRIIFNSEIFAKHKPYKIVNEKCISEALKSLGIQVCNSMKQNGGNIPLHVEKGTNGKIMYTYHANSSSSTPYESFCGGKTNWSQGIQPSNDSSSHVVCSSQQKGGKISLKNFKLSPVRLMQKTRKTKKNKIIKNKNFNSIIDNNSSIRFSKKAKDIINKAIKFYITKILMLIKKKKRYTHISKIMVINGDMIKKINLI